MSKETSQRRAQMLVRSYLYDHETDFDRIVQQCIDECMKELSSGAAEKSGSEGDRDRALNLPCCSWRTVAAL
jgi:hypothetical protein